MHTAAVGVTVTLLGVCAAAPESWPEEVDQKTFLEEALRLTREVADAATSLHGLGAASAPTGKQKIRFTTTRSEFLRGSVVVGVEDLLPDINDAGPVVAAAELYEQHVRSWHTSPYFGNPKLASVLAYLGGHSFFETVMSMIDNAPVAAVFAARMLLEEAARLRWLTSEAGSDDEFAQRSKRYFDEFRSRKKATISLLTGNGVRQQVAKKLFEFPDNVVEGPTDIAKGREPLPSIESMLRALGDPYPEPGWMCVAYSLLSQVTHSTPIGVLHLTRNRNDGVQFGQLTPEMLSLTLDVACLGSAHLLGTGSILLTGGSAEAAAYDLELHRRAYAVHNAARLVHGLD